MLQQRSASSSIKKGSIRLNPSQSCCVLRVRTTWSFPYQKPTSFCLVVGMWVYMYSRWTLMFERASCDSQRSRIHGKRKRGKKEEGREELGGGHCRGHSES